MENENATSSVFCFGGMSREYGVFKKKLVEKIAEKRNIKTCEATGF